MMYLKNTLLLNISVALFALFATPAAHATILPEPCPDSASLQAYINMTAGCTIEDKIFSDFSYSSAAQGGATAITADGVTVQPIKTAFDPGLQFEANWAASTGQVSDASIGFTVTVIGGAALIEDASLVQLSGSIIGTGTASVGEGICVGFNCKNTTFMLNTLNTTDSQLVQLGDQRIFSPSGQVRATKDIGLIGGQLGFGSVSVLADQFSEVVVSEAPEPGTIVLLGTALLGCTAILRSRAGRPR